MKSLAVVFWLFSALCNPIPDRAAASDSSGRQEPANRQEQLLQSKLKNTETAILSYRSKGNELHLRIITGAGTHSLCLPPGKTFSGDLRKMNRSLRARSAFDRVLAYRLYMKLIAPAERYLQGKKHLIIIPGKTTGFIPYEALVPDTASQRYLLHDYAISYAAGYSALINPSPPLSDYQRQKVLAMAPFNIPAAEKEIMNIQADYLLGGAASLQQFRRKAQDYSIIHLATRASISDRSHSFIDFSPAGKSPAGRYPASDAPAGKYRGGQGPDSGQELSSFRLAIRDIGRLNLQKVHLLVLSPAQLVNGNVSTQGLFSMAAAFARAGCPNFIGVRWDTRRETSERIFMKMHSYIHKGYGYARALQKARIDYLENPAIDESLKSPGYWSGFVLLGEIDTTSQSHKIFYYFALILTVLVVIFVLRRKKPHQSSC